VWRSRSSSRRHERDALALAVARSGGWSGSGPAGRQAALTRRQKHRRHFVPVEAIEDASLGRVDQAVSRCPEGEATA